MADTAENRVVFRDSLGNLFTVPENKTDKYLAKGATRVSDEEIRQLKGEAKYGGVSGAAINTGLSLLRGGTLGASDWALRGLGVDKETLAGYREFNPVSSVVGEIGGAVIPMLFTGGASAAASGAKAAGTLAKTVRTAGALPIGVAKLGARLEAGVAKTLGEEAIKGVAKKAAARAISKGVGAAAEGALFGAGQVVSEAALGDPAEVAEKAAAHIGMAALLGGGLGAAVGGLSGAFSGGRTAMTARAADRLAKKQEAATAAQRIGPEGVIRTDEAGVVGGVKAAGRDFVEEVKAVFDPDRLRARAVGAYGIGPVSEVRAERLFNRAADGTQRDALRFFGAKTRELGIVRGSDSIEQMAAKAKQASAHWGKELGKVYKQADEAVASGNVPISNPGIDASGRIRAVNLDAVIERAAKETLEDLSRGGLRIHRRVAKDVMSNLEEMRRMKGPAVDLKDIQEIKRGISDYCGWKKKAPTVANKAYRKVYFIFKDEVEKRLDELSQAIGGDLGKQLRTVSENWRAADLADTLASRAVSRRAGYAAFSLADIGVGTGAGAALGGPVGIMTGIGSAVASRVLKRRAPQFMASVIDTVSLRRFGVERLAQASSAAGTKINKIVDGITSTVAPTIRKTTRALARAETRAAGGMAAKHAAKEELEGQLGLSEGVYVAAPVGVAILKQVNFGAPEPEDKGKSPYRRRYDELTRTLANPSATQAQIAKAIRGMDEAAPAVSAQTGQLVMRSLQYLHQTAPKPPLHTDMAAATEPDGWEPNKHELQAWVDRINALAKPIDTIEAALHGHASRESVEAIKAVYPVLWRSVSMKVIEKYPELQKKLPYKRRLALSRTMGAPFEQTARPAFMRNVQALYGMGGAEPPGSGAPKVKVSGVNKMNIARRDMTDMERRSLR